MLSFFEEGAVGEVPGEDLHSALVEHDGELGLLHFEDELVVEGGVVGVGEGEGGDVGGGDLVLEGGGLGEAGVDLHLHDLQEHEGPLPVLDGLHSVPQFFQPVLIAQQTQFGSLHVFHVAVHHVAEQHGVVVAHGLLEEFAGDIAVALAGSALLVEDVEHFVEVVVLGGVEVAVEPQDVVPDRRQADVALRVQLLVLTIHYIIRRMLLSDRPF